ncbi:MAG TPA: sugar phosphate isomerase/epimerase [Bryobacteraceae bacterium]|nr:sugar phosphate isomerase/epimerase [Bryobacteraceae bacterium]
MLRRTFLGAIAAAASVRAQSPHALGIRLGYDSYSLRAWRWNAMQHIDYAAGLKLDSVQISSLNEFESLEPAYLQKVRERAAAARLVLDGGIGSICPTSRSWNPKNGTPTEYLSAGLRTAKAVGASAMRVFMGSSADRQGATPIERHIEETVKALKSVRSLALDLGVKIGIENHSGDMQARECRDLIEEAGRDYVGCCLDTGNPMWVLEDPLLTLEILGPYAVTTHIRDSVVFEHPRGAAWQWVVLGDGIVDWRRFIGRYRQLCPNATMQLENITGRPPRVVPYLEQDFWKDFPKARAADFASFVALAKRGRPLMAPMIIADQVGRVPAEYTEALKMQQKLDLERGLDFARKTLGVGVNWRS